MRHPRSQERSKAMFCLFMQSNLIPVSYMPISLSNSLLFAVLSRVSSFFLTSAMSDKPVAPLILPHHCPPQICRNNDGKAHIPDGDDMRFAEPVARETRAVYEHADDGAYVTDGDLEGDGDGTLCLTGDVLAWPAE